MTRKKTWKGKCKVCKGVYEKTSIKHICCGPDCALRYIKEENKKKMDKAWRKKKKEGLEKIKSLSEWKNDLQKEINWIIKQIDKDHPCISHPNMKGFLRYDAGHAYTVKAHSDIRFNAHNIHKQNSEANERYGFCVEYAHGIKSRYGQDYLEMVISLPHRWKGIGKEKFTIENIKESYLPAARRLKREMKNGLIIDRDMLNEQIGIYID